MRTSVRIVVAQDAQTTHQRRPRRVRKGSATNWVIKVAIGKVGNELGRGRICPSGVTGSALLLSRSTIKAKVLRPESETHSAFFAK